ncbi:MAG: PmoA family protein, partial [Bryobacteraceae bacterium]|nr:PmoA family protein [Bryobacteraceae bacterium]
MAAAVLTACISICTPPVSAKENDVSLKRFDDRIEVRLNGKPLTSFQFNAKWEKPFLYPIATASGLILSRGYPIETREGEEKDHPWHRGIWYGHGDISKEDFWREKPDKTTSRLVMSGAPQLSGNSLEVVLAMQSSKDRRMGTIRERYAFSQDAQNVFIDSTITIAADAGGTLTFGDTDDGGFGFRLSDDFREERGAELMNSDGLIGTKAIWGKPSRWVH